MSILNVEHLTHGFGDRAIFNDVSFRLLKGEHIGLIGANGEGKSTFMNIVTGTLTPDEGKVEWNKHVRVGYLDQHAVLEKGMTIEDVLKSAFSYLFDMEQNINEIYESMADATDDEIAEMMEEVGTLQDMLTNHDFYMIDAKVEQVARALGLLELGLDHDVTDLSGGQRTKVLLAKLLLEKPEILLLDEPTNHLDKRSREKLYDFITSCRITLLVVSHDRTLLNLLASIAELSVGGITLYGGNYDFYKGQKEQEQASMQKKLEAKEKELRRVRKTAREVAERKQKHESRGEKQSVRKGIPRIMMGGLKENAEKSASKLKEVHEDKMENLANELKQMRSSLPDLQGMKLDFSASGLHEGKILVTAKEINFGYAEAGDLWPSPMSFQIKSGERWLIQGDNGSGKTTLLKLITGQLPPRSGSLIRADFSSIYIDQEYSIVRNDRTVYEQAQAFNERHFQEHEIKTLLNRFLFLHDTWEKSCGKLSGGEKMRLAFCCLMISNQTPDLFILDEPTNNLDIQSIEIITSMVRAYRGTILLISHDAYFIRELGIHQIITTFAGRLKTNL